MNPYRINDQTKSLISVMNCEKMIPTDIYSTKEEALITSGVDAWLARIQAVLEHGKESGNITS